MDMVLVSASITIENGVSTQRYKWKSKNKVSVYRKLNKRAFVRITGAKFVSRLNSRNSMAKQININFCRDKNEWILKINRSKNKGSTLQTCVGTHPYLQLVLNKHLPKEIWREHELSGKRTYTRPINVEFDLDEWKDLKIGPSVFLVEVEKLPKTLLDHSLKNGFKIDFVPKGRSYDLELIGPEGNKFILAISSHVAKNQSRSKEKRKQKILMDISKMLPVIYNQKVYPIIISEPLEYEGSWSFTTDFYLNFYKERFGFKFLTTDFKKDWEENICNQLLELDKNGQL